MPLYANHFTFWREESINSVIRAPVARATHRSYMCFIISNHVWAWSRVYRLCRRCPRHWGTAEVIIDEGDANGTNDLSNQGDTDTGMQQKVPIHPNIDDDRDMKGHALIYKRKMTCPYIRIEGHALISGSFFKWKNPRKLHYFAYKGTPLNAR